MVSIILISRTSKEPYRIFVPEKRKQPTKITRKTHKEWTQNMEIEFIRYDLPVECAMNGYDLKKCLLGYIEGMKKRTKPFMEGFPWDKEECIMVAKEVLSSIPRVWNIGELKDGKQNNHWAIKYQQGNIVEYTSY